MAVILFYSPFNQRSRDTESLMIAFKNEGHSVISLSQQEGFIIHPFLEQFGIKTYSYVVKGKRKGWWYFLKHLLYFVSFCWKNKVTIVYAHLEPANFVAAVGQYCVKAKVFLCRHHIDEGALYQFNKNWYYRITYALAKKIIVVSDHAKQYMIEKEHIPQRKILHINLAYDFKLYSKPSDEVMRQLKNEFGSGCLILVGACRLTKFKRPNLLIEIAKILHDKGLNFKLILLGKGEMENELIALIQQFNLEDKVILPGYVSNVLDYIACCDFFLHPSILESSCVVIKEAGLVKKPVIVCKNVGDFDDYICNDINGFSVDKDNFIGETVSIIESYYNKREELLEIGNKLHSDIYKNFSVDHILVKYKELNRQ
jgi:glycosyltransferase involved in cell wall biosynthesis